MPVAELAATLDRVLGDVSNYLAHGIRLRDAVQPLALSGSAVMAGALGRRLDGPFPAVRVSLFGGALVEPAANVARWYLLWAIGLNGHGRVPLALVSEAWMARPNRAEKYLEPAPAAAWTVAQVGQDDQATLDALIRRLGAPDQPVWLDGDLVGALTVLTGQRFGYDRAGWRGWWARRQAGSDERLDASPSK